MESLARHRAFGSRVLPLRWLARVNFFGAKQSKATRSNAERKAQQRQPKQRKSSATASEGQTDIGGRERGNCYNCIAVMIASRPRALPMLAGARSRGPASLVSCSYLCQRANPAVVTSRCFQAQGPNASPDESQELEEEYAKLRVNWFPGHMVKATNIIREKLKQVRYPTCGTIICLREGRCGAILGRTEHLGLRAAFGARNAR